MQLVLSLFTSAHLSFAQVPEQSVMMITAKQIAQAICEEKCTDKWMSCRENAKKIKMTELNAIAKRELSEQPSLSDETISIIEIKKFMPRMDETVCDIEIHIVNSKGFFMDAVVSSDSLQPKKIIKTGMQKNPGKIELKTAENNEFDVFLKAFVTTHFPNICKEICNDKLMCTEKTLMINRSTNEKYEPNLYASKALDNGWKFDKISRPQIKQDVHFQVSGIEKSKGVCAAEIAALATGSKIWSSKFEYDGEKVEKK
jgi:hypothetical protein